jgi:hypothetical protein
LVNGIPGGDDPDDEEKDHIWHQQDQAAAALATRYGEGFAPPTRGRAHRSGSSVRLLAAYFFF